jgi:hypothetical protein
MATLFTRIVLFLSSYSPLFVLFAVKQYPHSHKIAYSFIGLSAFALLVLFAFIQTGKKLASSKIVIKEHVARDGDAMSYIVTYLVPFLDIKFTEFENVIGLGIIFFVLGILYVNSNMIYMNPVLNLVGLHIFDTRTSDDRPLVLITRRSFLPSDVQLPVALFGDYAGLEVKQ